MRGSIPRLAGSLPVLAALTALCASGPAFADQFKQTADGGTIDCEVSAHELTRFALVGDAFASVSKIGTGTPYNDFAVTNEPVRGDIYVSVPEVYAAARISFFATTKKGYVYKFACPIRPIEAQQVFVTNPAIAKDAASDWEKATPIETSAVRLVQAMAGNAQVPGFTVRQPSSLTSPTTAPQDDVVAYNPEDPIAAQAIRRDIELVVREDRLLLATERFRPTGEMADGSPVIGEVYPDRFDLRHFAVRA